MDAKHPERCPRCRQATFHVEVGLTKPRFVCDNGCSAWSCGRDGGEYLKHARNYEGGGPQRWVGFIWRGDEMKSTGHYPRHDPLSPTQGTER